MNGGNFKLGLFVTVAVLLLALFLLVLGTLDRFKPRVRVETYFPQSIQNLQTRAPVRFPITLRMALASVKLRATQLTMRREESRLGMASQAFQHTGHFPSSICFRVERVRSLSSTLAMPSLT